MPLGPNTSYSIHRGLYAGIFRQVTLFKRADDQREADVRVLHLFECRRSSIHKAGEPIQGDMASYHRTTWHIPKIELDRVGVHHINAIDRIYDPILGEWWQAESPQTISEKLFGNMVNIDCTRIDPPNGSPSS